MTDITNGPWYAGNEFMPNKFGHLPSVIAISATGEVVAHVNCGFGRGADNAALISAAPELLAALLDLLPLAECYARDSHPTAWKERLALAHAAINKAEGRKPAKRVEK